jgi:hypothetical protein
VRSSARQFGVSFPTVRCQLPDSSARIRRLDGSHPSSLPKRHKVLDGDAAAIHLQEPPTLEGVKDLVDALARTSDHRAEVALRHAEVELGGPVVGSSRPLDASRQELRDPSFEIEEDQVGRLTGEPTNERARRAKERLGDVRIALEQRERNVVLAIATSVRGLRAPTDAEREPPSKSAMTPKASGVEAWRG